MKEVKPLVTIQILNWNRAEETQHAIQSAKNQTYSNIEIIVVDNGSTDNSVQLTRENHPDVQIIELDRNYGCPGGRNKGIPYCKGEFIFYLDNDGVLHEKALENAYRNFLNNDKIGIVTGIVYDFGDFSEIDPKCEVRNDIQYNHNNFQGGICMHKKSIYKELGTYPSHFKYGAEEFYLTIKAFEHEIGIVKDESVILWHKRSEIARDREGEIISTYFNKLYTSIVLYPKKEAVKFILYFLTKYPFYANRDRVFKRFVTSGSMEFIKTFQKGLKDRSPVSENGYKDFKSFKRHS